MFSCQKTVRCFFCYGGQKKRFQIKNEWTEALENIYFAAEDLEREFSKIIYFLPDEPKELVSNLLGELDNNEQDRKFNKMLSEAVAQFENRQEADEIYER